MKMVKAFDRTLSQKQNQNGDESIEEPRLDLLEKNEVKAKRPRKGSSRCPRLIKI